MMGKLLSTTDTSGANIGQINPFLYRGYYYDSETGLYYLNSRYYDPQAERFISADDTSTLQDTQQQSLLSTNLFAYCNNNPVVNSDPTGQSVVNTLIDIAGVILTFLSMPPQARLIWSILCAGVSIYQATSASIGFYHTYKSSIFYKPY